MVSGDGDVVATNYRNPNLNMLKIQVLTFPGKEDKPMDMNVLAFSLEIRFFGFCLQNTSLVTGRFVYVYNLDQSGETLLQNDECKFRNASTLFTKYFR